MLSGRYLIGRHTVDFDSKRISLGERPVAVHWRGVEALRALAEVPGEVVPRDRFFEALWPGTVVDESNLGKVISQLRRSLEESDPGTAYIETLPGAGYRLVAPVQPTATVPPVSAPSPRAWTYPRWRLAAGVALLALVSVAGAARWLRPDPKLRAFEESFARGNELLASRDPARVAEAVGQLRRATELNPRSAPAFAALAHALNRQGGEVSVLQGVRAPALEAAERSVALDPDCAGCNGTLGLFLMSYTWQWDRSLLHLEKAIRGEPANTSIRPSYALHLLATGNLSEGLAQVDIALREAPFHAGYHAIRARALYFMKRYSEAVDAADRSLSIQPADLAGWEWKSQALLQMGQIERGIEAITARRYPQNTDQAMNAARAGGLKAALTVLIGASGDSGNHSWRRARWKALLGNLDGALQELDIAIRRKHFEAMFIAVDPVFEPLHQDPRFLSLLERAGLRVRTPSHGGR